MKKSIKQLEQESECTLYEGLRDYVESCIRTEHYDDEDNIDYFMRENSIISSERGIVADTYMTALNDFIR